MLRWSKHFIRQGFNVTEVQEDKFDCRMESEENISFLLKTLNKGNIAYVYQAPWLTIDDTTLPEKQWIELINVRGRGRTEMIGVEAEELQVEKLDTYISGIVHELNRMIYEL